MLKIQIITGSTRPGRVNKQVAEWVYSIASKRANIEVEIVDIADYNLPLLDEPASAMMGTDYTKDHTKKFSQKIAQADGYIFVTPEYNHSTSGALKNAIDFLYHEWSNKPASFVSYGAEGGVRAVEHLRGVLAQIQVATTQQQVNFTLGNDFENYSTLKPANDSQEKNTEALLDQLTVWAEALKTIRN